MSLNRVEKGRRSTVHLVDLIKHVNDRNKLSKLGPDFRNGANILLEDMLHANNVYAGFGYYGADDLAADEKPGVIFHRDGAGNLLKSEFPDETRRFYYIHRSLRKDNR